MNDLTKPWRGIPRELIQWYPRIEEEICIGCGMCDRVREDGFKI